MSPLHRPPPIRTRTGRPVDRGDPTRAARRLLAGETLWVRDHYQTGVGVIDALVAALGAPADIAGHADKQRYREAFREHASRLIAPVEAGRVALPGAPRIGLLAELYPEPEPLWLPFPALRDLAHASRLYDEGVPMPVLGHRLHPFYGTYLPNRSEHLELFATWLSGYRGARDTAFDVGTGSGVLALMLARAGFARVVATDSSPNACESVRREIGRRPDPPPIQVRHADLLGEGDERADLVVFNPPWIPGPVEGLLDRALHYDDDLFERFFGQARDRLAADARVVVVFSNIGRLLLPEAPHPLEAELERGRFGLVNTMTRRIKGGPRRTRERVEVWELAPR